MRRQRFFVGLSRFFFLSLFGGSLELLFRCRAAGIFMDMRGGGGKRTGEEEEKEGEGGEYSNSNSEVGEACRRRRRLRNAISPPPPGQEIPPTLGLN